MPRRPDFDDYMKERLADQRPFEQRMSEALPLAVATSEKTAGGAAEVTMLFRSYEEARLLCALIHEARIGREAAIANEWMLLDGDEDDDDDGGDESDGGRGLAGA